MQLYCTYIYIYTHIHTYIFKFKKVMLLLDRQHGGGWTRISEKSVILPICYTVYASYVCMYLITKMSYVCTYIHWTGICM